MIRNFVSLATMLGLLGCACAASGTELIIHLSGNGALSRKTVEYRCDGNAAQIGLPAGPFSVEYINGGGNMLAVVPISGNSLIFSNVVSGSGARYTTQQYTWWEAKGMVMFSSDSPAGKMQSTCRPVNGK